MREPYAVVGAVVHHQGVAEGDAPQQRPLVSVVENADAVGSRDFAVNEQVVGGLEHERDGGEEESHAGEGFSQAGGIGASTAVADVVVLRVWPVHLKKQQTRHQQSGADYGEGGKGQLVESALYHQQDKLAHPPDDSWQRLRRTSKGGQRRYRSNLANENRRVSTDLRAILVPGNPARESRTLVGALGGKKEESNTIVVNRWYRGRLIWRSSDLPDAARVSIAHMEETHSVLR